MPKGRLLFPIILMASRFKMVAAVVVVVLLVVGGVCGVPVQEKTRSAAETDSQSGVSNSGSHRNYHIDCVQRPSDEFTLQPVAEEWLRQYDMKSQQYIPISVQAAWTYNTNITQYNQHNMVEERANMAVFYQDAQRCVKQILDWNSQAQTENKIKEEKILKGLDILHVIGDSVLPEDKYIELSEILSTMGSRYSTAKICEYDPNNADTGNCIPTLSLDPDLTNILEASRDYDELLHVWRAWRDAVGPAIRDDYLRFVQLTNEASRLQDYPDTGARWRGAYKSSIGDREAASFMSEVEALHERVRPMYEHLHAYVRRELRRMYGVDKVSETGPIPAHLLGNMWAQTWGNLYKDTVPYKGKPLLDITDSLVQQSVTPERMFEISEEFFTSLGLEPMPELFWNKSMIVKPEGREVACHASAWDFYNGKDFRIKQCTEITMSWLITTHHEMGHVQYYLQYKHLPTYFRRGANPGFHEALGDLMALSVATPKHLHEIGFLDEIDLDDTETDLNFLYLQALDKIAFLPFGYLIDKYRWQIFSGEITEDNLNEAWWKLRVKYQGIDSPIPRSENDFDAGAKYHIPNNTPYIRYFVSFLLQFQFHSALCKEAGQTGQLHQCDIYNSADAGNKLKDMLRMGLSEWWPHALASATGSDHIDADAILDYFSPLVDWLREQNRGKFVGWTKHIHCPNITPNPRTLIADTRTWLSEYNAKAREFNYASVLASWNHATNITEYNQKKKLQASAESAEFRQDAQVCAQIIDTWHTDLSSQIPEDQLDTPAEVVEYNLQLRALGKLKVIGDSVLNTDDYNELQNLLVSMQTVYSTSRVCKNDWEVQHNNCTLELEPDLVQIMANSDDYDELLHAWKGWRDAVGKRIKGDYIDFVKLTNRASQLQGFSDTGELWRSRYKKSLFSGSDEDADKEFQGEMEELYEQVKALYQQLHAYVRRRLVQKFGRDRIDIRGPIPAHLTGNMWSQQWGSLYDDTTPYPSRPSVDVTHAMQEKNMTAVEMFQISDKFFTDLGLAAMPAKFWSDSMILKPDDRDVVCHASAWDFYNEEDFRIKQCTDITMKYLITTHHEMGHIEYFLQYKDQPVVFRDGANPGFHEAIGDLLALSVSTPAHLNAIGLLDISEDQEQDSETELNFLYRQALDKIAFLPFGYILDKWRWGVFSGEIPESKMNEEWWNLRYLYQGLKAPVTRTEDDFDMGAKFHIPNNTPYIRYFVSHILQFQLHKALCEKAGHTGPLHTCDIDKSTEAGDALGDMMALGSSQDWPEALAVVTGGDRKLSADALLEYFRPLTEWLHTQNTNTDEFIGWTGSSGFIVPAETSTEPTLNSAPSGASISALLLTTSLLALLLQRLVGNY